MAISKKMRETVWQKYGGRCAYCGRKIKLCDMQVDHFIPKNGYFAQGTDDLSNLMPSCRMCNHIIENEKPIVFFFETEEAMKDE